MWLCVAVYVYAIAMFTAMVKSLTDNVENYKERCCKFRRYISFFCRECLCSTSSILISPCNHSAAVPFRRTNKQDYKTGDIYVSFVSLCRQEVMVMLVFSNEINDQEDILGTRTRPPWTSSYRCSNSRKNFKFPQICTPNFLKNSGIDINSIHLN